MHQEKRDIFKKRKSKVYKTLVSYGHYGVIVGLTMLALGNASTVSADETVEEAVITAGAPTVDEGSVAVAAEPTPVSPLSVEESVSEVAGATAMEGLTSKEIAPKSVEVSLTGKDRLGQDLADNSEVFERSSFTFNVAMDLVDGSVLEGDTFTLQLPETVYGRPSVTEVKNKQDEVVANLNVTGDSAKLIFTDVLSKGHTGKLDFSFGVIAANDTIWPISQPSEMVLTDTSGNKYSTGINLKKYASTAIDFGTSTRLWPADLLPDENGNKTVDPYQFWHQSEVAKFGDGQPRKNVTIVYTIDPDTQDYARYDVETIRNNGYEIRFGESRRNHTRYNTKNNDRGITATVNDEGTELVLTFPEWPANWGFNGGSIPTNLTDLAKSVKYSHLDGNTYNATMTTYVDGELRGGGHGVKHTKNFYPFADADASQGQSVITKFIDVDTNEEIAKSVAKRLSQGDPYTTSSVDVEYYRLVSTPSNATGVVTKGNTTVTYGYKKIGDVIVHYVLQNEDGTTTEFDPDVVLKEKAIVGEDYTTLPLAQSVLDTKPKPESKVEQFENRTEATTYEYQLIEQPANAEGQVAHKLTEVTYVYKLVPITTTVYKYGNVTVEHVAENGTILKAKEAVVTDEVVGTAYSTQPLTESELVAPEAKVEEFEDKIVTTTYSYELVEVPANAKGQVKAGNTSVTYTYKLVATETAVPKLGSVTVEYVLEDGTVLKAKEAVVTDVVVGTDYRTQPLTESELVVPEAKVEEFADKTVMTTYSYELVEIPSNANGKVSEGNTSVIYTYKLVATETAVPKLGSVTVEHVAEDGTILKAKETVASDAVVGTDYSTQPLTELVAPADKVVVDGSTIITIRYHYELVSIPANATGTVVEGETAVVYVYKLVETVTRTEIPTEKPTQPSNEDSTPSSEVSNKPSEAVVTPVISSSVSALTNLSMKQTASVDNVLPETGEDSSTMLGALGVSMLLVSVGLKSRKRREED